MLELFAPSSELRLTRGFLDLTLAYAGVLMGIYALAAAYGSFWLRAAIRIWWHVEFVLRSVEAVLLYRFGIGYSPLVLYHVDRVSLRLALVQGWPGALAIVATAASVDWIFRRLPAQAAGRRWPARVAVALLLVFAVRSVFVLYRERRRLPQEFAAASLAENWFRYARTNRSAERLSLTTAEQARLDAFGIQFETHALATARPLHARNLITIYLEGFQANFTQAGGNVHYPGLTPNLDRFASGARFYGGFYNAVTPTINSLISSQCGILSQVENDELDIDRGYTRNLSCLSDILHDAGYRQVFLGGADSGFSGKRLFLDAHRYDDVWGWERWNQTTAYARNAWGLQDTDLMRDAAARLPQLRANGPFHLTILTVNTHQPGFIAADCPVYLAGRVMLNAIHCTDHAIGMLMETLEAGGYFEDTVVIMMGDHTMFPSPESAAALGPLSAGWFGRVFMAIHQPEPEGSAPAPVDMPGYTPDLAPTALDALGFRPVPQFPVGRSLLGPGDAVRVLVAPRYQVIDGRMIPEGPGLTDGCSEEMVARSVLEVGATAFGDCERDKIIAFLNQSLLAPIRLVFERRTN
jgi:phosphoglycerol transferase MdoB-like AlkP superfamily enzyme